jgi:hypothetical protein
VDHVDVDSQLATKPSRHPDGVQPRHSIRTVAE